MKPPCSTSLVNAPEIAFVSQSEALVSKLFIKGRRKSIVHVDFRRMLSNLNERNRATHLIHRYPAKLIHHIPHLFTECSMFSKPGEIVADTFCGSGTVLLEAMLSQRNAVGFELNPLSALISKVKTTPLDPSILQVKAEKLFRIIEECNPDTEVISFPNINFWFTPKSQRDLNRIKKAIQQADFDRDFADFFLVCFSSIVRTVSNADPRISPPVYSKRMHKLLKGKRRPDAVKCYRENIKTNIQRMEKLWNLWNKSCLTTVYNCDSRKLPIGDESIDLVITSPPYMNAQKYFRSMRLEFFWLDLGTRDHFASLDAKAIGTERIKSKDYTQFKETGVENADMLLKEIFEKNRERAYLAAKYFNDMQIVIEEIYRVLKKGKHLVLVGGNNSVCGRRFPSHEIMSEIAAKSGFDRLLMLVDNIKSRGLMTKRNKTAGMINSEWVLILRK